MDIPTLEQATASSGPRHALRPSSFVFAFAFAALIAYLIGSYFGPFEASPIPYLTIFCPVFLLSLFVLSLAGGTHEDDSSE